MPTTPTLPVDGSTTLNAALFATYRDAILELQAGGANIQITVSQTSHGFAARDVLRYGTASFAKARANLEANCIDVVGIVVSVTDANTFVLHIGGYVTGLTAGLVADTVYYLSAATDGLLTTTKPTTGFVVPVLKTKSDATTAFMLPFRAIQAVLPIAEGGTGAATAADARTNLGLAIGTNVQAYHATLAAVAGGTYVGAASITTLGTIATGTWQGSPIAVAYGGTGATSAADARTNLGLGTADSPQFTAINLGHASDTTITRTGAGDIAIEGNAVYRAGGTDVPVTDGGTGASDAATARTNLGAAAASHTHGQADVTNLVSDLAAKAPLASPTFTGVPAAPTAAAGTNTTQLATTAYVQTAIAGLISFQLACIQGASGNLWATGTGTWTGSGTDGNGFAGNTLTNTSNANGDYVTKQFTVPASGTWKCRVVANATNGSGILDVLLNTVSKGTHDFYDASAGVYNQWSAEITLGALTANTVYTLDLKVNGKNASSSGYRLYLHQVEFYR